MSARRSAPEGLLRTSTRREFTRCQQRWVWGSEEGWTPKDPGMGALWFGTGVHLALADYYLPGKKRGKHPAQTWKDYCDSEYNWIRSGEYGTPEEEFVKAKDLGIGMMEGYIEHYGRDRNWRVIQPERTGLVRVPHPLIKGAFIVTYAFTVDLVYFDEVSETIKLGEHKTAAAINTGHLTLDKQAGSYPPFMTTLLRADGLLKPNERIQEITYNFLRKALPTPDDRPKNKAGQYLNQDGSVSKRQSSQAPLFVRHGVERTAAERQIQVRHIQREWHQMEMIRRGEIEPTKNTTRDCQYDCQFFALCELHEAGGDWETLLTATMKKRDPNEPYRKAA